MLNKYENSLDKSDCLGNTQQDKIQEQEKGYSRTSRT